MENFDLIILGAGPAGYTAAACASKLGKKVLCIESGKAGGTCLNCGCIPTKSLLKSAEVFKEVSDCAAYGITAPITDFDFAKVRAKIDASVERLRKGVEFIFKKGGIKYLNATGKILQDNIVEAVLSDGSVENFKAQKILVCTGASPRKIANADYSSNKILTSSGALSLSVVPKSVVVVGAGAIGVEFAYAWKIFGSDVTLIEMADAVLPLEDADSSAAITRSFRRLGVKIKTGAKLLSANADGCSAFSKIECAGKEEILESEYVLICAGVIPNAKNISDTDVLIETCPRGFIKVDGNFETSVKNVYAAGDVVGDAPLLAHVAIAQAKIATNAMFLGKTEKLSKVPSCVYCTPEVASVGRSEKSARSKFGENVGVSKFPMLALGRAVACDATDGFAKIVYALDSKKILGAQIVGFAAGEIIAEIALAINLGGTVEDVAKTIHAHPSFSESVMEAASL